MRNLHTLRNLRRLVLFCAGIGVLTAMPFLSSARPAPATSVNIVNNSSRAIRDVYLSSVQTDDWSGSQLGGATIGPGQSFNLANIACNQQQIKVIGEDQDGCFVSTVVTCGETSTWTVTDDTPRDCGN